MNVKEPPKPGGAEAAKKAGSWQPTLKKVGEFALGILQLQRSVERLKDENGALRREVQALQRQVDEQAGQLKAIQSFVQTAVYEHAARSGERAALTLVQQMLASESGGE